MARSKRYTARVELPLTAEQYAAISARAAAQGLALSVYIRLRLAADFAPFTPPPVTYEAPPPSPLPARRRSVEENHHAAHSARVRPVSSESPDSK